MSSFEWPPTGSGTTAFLKSINSDTTQDQLIVVGSAGTNFAIVDNGTGTHTFNLPTASAVNTGKLSAADWVSFNAKQAAGNYITALTGDGSASGPGSASLTFATVNGNVGSFTNASLTVNAKGLVTAASSGAAPVTAVSVATANGFAGSSSGGTTPALTLSTTINAPALAGNGTAMAAATTTGSGSTVVLASAPTLTNPVVGTQSQGDSSTKAASTSYVDVAVANAVAGVNPAVAVNAATTAAGDTSGFTYNNGASGVGAFFTGSVNTAVTIDGFTFTTLGQRLLVKNDTQSPSGAFNGIYSVTQIQTGILAPILTRALDYNTPTDMNNTGAVPVINGTVNGTTSWVQTALVVTVGTTPLIFAKFTRNPADYLLVANNLSDVANKATSFNNLSPMTTGGDLIYGGSSGAGTRLANGSANQVLLSAGGTSAPTWGTTPIAGGGTGQVTKAAAFDALSPMSASGDIIYGGASGTGTRLAKGSDTQVLTLASGVPTWATPAAGSVPTAPYDINNVGISTSVSANALTINLTQSDGSTNPSSGTAAALISFRSATQSSGSYTQRSVTGALSVVVPSGATLGQTSAMNQYVFVYALDNAGTVELAVSGVKLFDQNARQSTTAISGAATSGTVLYSTSARTNVGIRYLGRLLSNQTVAGTYAAAITEVDVGNPPTQNITDWATGLGVTTTGFGTPSSTNYIWRRVGDTLFLRGSFITGTCTAVPGTLNLPAGYVIDGTKLTGTATAAQLGIGTFATSVGPNAIWSNDRAVMWFYDGTHTSAVYLTNQNASGGYNGAQNVNGFVTNGWTIIFDLQIPIVGWSLYGP